MKRKEALEILTRAEEGGAFDDLIEVYRYASSYSPLECATISTGIARATAIVGRAPASYDEECFWAWIATHARNRNERFDATLISVFSCKVDKAKATAPSEAIEK